MQQNDILDLFYDDWMALADDDSSFGTKADNHLKVIGNMLVNPSISIKRAQI